MHCYSTLKVPFVFIIDIVIRACSCNRRRLAFICDRCCGASPPFSKRVISIKLKHSEIVHLRLQIHQPSSFEEYEWHTTRSELIVVNCTNRCMFIIFFYGATTQRTNHRGQSTNNTHFPRFHMKRKPFVCSRSSTVDLMQMCHSNKCRGSTCSIRQVEKWKEFEQRVGAEALRSTAMKFPSWWQPQMTFLCTLVLLTNNGLRFANTENVGTLEG